MFEPFMTNFNQPMHAYALGIATGMLLLMAIDGAVALINKYVHFKS